MDPVIEKKWDKVVQQVEERFGMEPDLKGILFLIGLRETGSGKKDYAKEEKEDFMNLAICRILSISGYFEFQGIDERGWPDWEQKEAFPRLELDQQEVLLKEHIVKYFEEQALLESS